MIRLAPPCRVACPAGINVQAYISHIADGKFDEALAVIREDNPFPCVCGRICFHPCEAECARGRIDQPVAINHLKLFVAQQAFQEKQTPPDPAEKKYGEKIAIVGSGPAGLTAAYFLAKKGYPITVFESKKEPGGKLRSCIAPFRLPRKELDADIDFIKATGVEIQTNVKFGQDVTIDKLRSEGYKAFFMAMGVHQSRQLGVESEDLEGVVPALEFLEAANAGMTLEKESRVMVIGGGNSALESARVAKRMGGQVELFSVLPRRESPASEEDFIEAEKEGIIVHFSTLPKRFIGRQNKVCQAELMETRLGSPDEIGRKSPVPVEGTQRLLDVDLVIVAIGEEPETLPMPEGVNVSSWGMVNVDNQTLKTDAQDIFAGGDLVTGTSSVVEAIAAGKRAAANIDAMLQNTPVEFTEYVRQTPGLPKHILNRNLRHLMPQTPFIDRIGNFDPVVLGYSAATAKDEAARCLKCGNFNNLLYQEVISQGLCTACGACVGTCPNGSIELKGVIPTLTGVCEGCGSCFEACPGKDIRIDRLDIKISGREREPYEKRIGIHLDCYAANSKSDDIRENATSGGVITGLLNYAFDKNLIDGALVTTMNPENPIESMPMLALKKEDLVASQKTKYMLVPGGLLSILRDAAVEKDLQRIAVVGSPCHIHAVRKIQFSPNQYLRTKIGEKIKYLLGLNCAFNFFPEGTYTMIQAMGMEAKDIASIGWRDTSEVPFPGQFTATAKDGEKRSMDLLQEYIILGGIYDHPRCRLCYDWANEIADISSGDEVDETGFHKQGAQRSHTVVRTQTGKSLFDAAVSDGYIVAEKVTEDDIARNLGFVIKKVGNIPRIEERRQLGLPLPDYGNFPFYI